MTRLIRQGRVFSSGLPDDGAVLDIEIDAGVIRQIAPSIDPAGKDVIDASGCFVIPGLVDLHAHFREPGGEQQETFESGSRAAAHGGITTALAMPNTTPPLDHPAILQKITSRLSGAAGIHIALTSAMTLGRKGKEPVDFAANQAAGASAFSDDGTGVSDEAVLLEICRQAAATGALLIEHPENACLSKGAPLSEGSLSQKWGLTGQAAEAESLDILKFGTIAGMLGARIHFTHISTEKSLEAVRFLKKIYGSRITADVTPHHLLLSENDNPDLDPLKKMNPPLRPESDRAALEQGLLEGVIDAIATDHAPHTAESKQRPFAEAPFGVTGFETWLPATFTHFVKSGKASMKQWLDWVCARPAAILGVPGGRLAVGSPADLAVFGPADEVRIEPGFFLSRSQNSAFLGHAFFGRVRHTLCAGRTVYEG